MKQLVKSPAWNYRIVAFTLNGKQIIRTSARNIKMFCGASSGACIAAAVYAASKITPNLEGLVPAGIAVFYHLAAIAFAIETVKFHNK